VKDNERNGYNIINFEDGNYYKGERRNKNIEGYG